MVVYLQDARRDYLSSNGDVDWSKVRARWLLLAKTKTSLANKHYTAEVERAANALPQPQQQRLLDVMMGGLVNDDSSVGVYATSPDDYATFAFFLEPIIREYHSIEGDVKQQHDWNIPVGTYLLSNINADLRFVSMRARVARNVKGFNLPPLMTREERVKFEQMMVQVFATFTVPGKYYSLTPGHPQLLSSEEADAMRKDHFLFNDMTTDNHLTSSGVAGDWPHGRGIWLSQDKSKMVWVGEEDHLRIISIVHGTDLGAVDASLYSLLSMMEKAQIAFAEHPVYGVVTTCPTNMGTGKRQSILAHFPNLTSKGTDEKNLKLVAKAFGLQARGVAGEHSSMDALGTADISPSARFGVTEAEVTKRLYEGLQKLYGAEAARSLVSTCC